MHKKKTFSPSYFLPPNPQKTLLKPKGKQQKAALLLLLHVSERTTNNNRAELGCSIEPSSCIRNLGSHVAVRRGESMSHSARSLSGEGSAEVTSLSSAHSVLSFM